MASDENKELQMFLEEEEDQMLMRKEKFKAFAKRYGLDQVLHL